MAMKARRRCTSYTHSYKIFGYIAGADVVYEYQAQQIALEIIALRAGNALNFDEVELLRAVD